MMMMCVLLTILVSLCELYPDGEEEPLLLPPIGGPGIPGILGTGFDDLATYTHTHTDSKHTGRQKIKTPGVCETHRYDRCLPGTGEQRDGLTVRKLHHHGKGS